MKRQNFRPRHPANRSAEKQDEQIWIFQYVYSEFLVKSDIG